MEIVRTVKVSEHPWINLFVRTYRLRGQERQWVFASRHRDPSMPAQGIDAVVIVPLLLAEGAPPRLVVIREFRVPLGDYEYGFPAGLVEAGESLESAARRELQEETGLEVIEVTRVSPPTYSSSGFTDECVAIVFVTARAPQDRRQRLEDGEAIEVHELDYDQVAALCTADVRVNGRTWPILLLFEQLGELRPL